MRLIIVYGVLQFRLKIQGKSFINLKPAAVKVVLWQQV